MNLTNTELWVSIIGAALVVIGILGLYKTKKMKKTFTWIGVVGLALGLALPFFGFSPLTAIAGGIGATTLSIGESPATDLEGGTCFQTTASTVTLSAIDAGTGAAVGGNHKYRINNGPISRVADGGTFSATPGQSLQILWGDNQTDPRYGVLQETTVPCESTYIVTDNNGPVRMWRNGTATVTFFTENDVVMQNGTNATLGSSGIVNLKWKFQTESNKVAYPYGAVMLFDVNKSVIKIDQLKAYLDGAELQSMPVPVLYNSRGGGFQTIAFRIPPIGLTGAIEHIGSLHIEADTNNEPGAGIDNGEDNAIITEIRGLNYYTNELASGGPSFAGPAAEDETNAQTILSTLRRYVYYQ